jgi:hypothetical protein
MDVRTDENYRESWWIRNNTHNQINIGDLPLIPTIKPGKRVDALRHYSREKVSHSLVLVDLIKARVVTLNKKKIFANNNNIPVGQADTSVTPAEENEIDQALADLYNSNTYLNIDGGNANQTIDIGEQDFTTTGIISGGGAVIGDNQNPSQGGFFEVTRDGNAMPKGSASIVLQKDPGIGIKFDQTNPEFGWTDLLGAINTRPSAGQGAAAVPDYVQYRDNIYAFRFGTVNPNDHLHEAFIEYHIPHDYVPGTDIYIHTHWSQIVVDDVGGGVPGVSEWFFDISYADGYGTAGGTGDPFIAPKTISVTQQASTTQYAHMIAEVIITGATDTSTTFDRTKPKVDGIFLVRVYRDPGSANDTLVQDTFLHYVDMHHQTTNVGTKNRNTPFYT